MLYFIAPVLMDELLTQPQESKDRKDLPVTEGVNSRGLAISSSEVVLPSRASTSSRGFFDVSSGETSYLHCLDKGKS